MNRHRHPMMQWEMDQFQPQHVAEFKVWLNYMIDNNDKPNNPHPVDAAMLAQIQAKKTEIDTAFPGA